MKRALTDKEKEIIKHALAGMVVDRYLNDLAQGKVGWVLQPAKKKASKPRR